MIRYRHTYWRRRTETHIVHFLLVNSKTGMKRKVKGIILHLIYEDLGGAEKERFKYNIN